MKAKGEHRGHCQACGRVQVVEIPQHIAKHGYRVAGFGYFNGTCSGSMESPLEMDRTITDAIIKDLNAQAARNEVRATALRAGTLQPEQAQELVLGKRQWVWSGPSHSRAREPKMVKWADASPRERQMQIEQDAGEAESFARHARSHAKSMAELADKVHGQPLIDRDAEELAKVNARKAKTQPIEGAYRSKAEQKRALEKLSRAYARHRETMSDWLIKPTSTEPYYQLPFDLYAWRPKHTAHILNKFPELVPTVRVVEQLAKERAEIVARPVIKYGVIA
jgi:hypothetical protein